MNKVLFCLLFTFVLLHTHLADLKAQSGNFWETIATTPQNVWDGGALVSTNNGEYIYALRGDNTTDFWRYSVSGNTWISLANTPQGVRHGGALVYPGNGDYVYALAGNNSTDFWRYSILGNVWEALANTPQTVRHGGDLVYPGIDDYIFALRGNNSTDFWKYSITNNSWESQAATPQTVRRGGSLVYPIQGDYIYAIRGENNSDFWRFSISNNNWESLINVPANVMDGAGLVYPGSGNDIYAFSGNNESFFLRYSILNNSWENLANTPENIWRGAALVYPGKGAYIYALRANNTSGFWRYKIDDFPKVLTTSWTGSISSDWHNSDNWSGGVIPDKYTDILIQSSSAYFPVLEAGQLAFCQNIIIESGASLITHLDRFVVYGDFINYGEFNCIEGSVELKGNLENNGNEIIEGDFYLNGSVEQIVQGNVIFDHLIIENTEGVQFSAVSGQEAEVAVREKLTLTSGAHFSAASNVTLKSNADQTAYLIDNSGLSNPITGDINIERFLPGNHQGYRFLSSPVESADIQNDIFGFNVSGQHGVKYYIYDYINSEQNANFNSWGALYANVFRIQEHASATAPQDGNVYRFYEGYVQGIMDVGAGYSFYTQGNSTVTFRGTPNTGDVSINLTNTTISSDSNNDGWNLVGNPYPSPIHWSEITGINGINLPSGMNNGFYIFNSSGSSNAFRGTYGSFINGNAVNLNDGPVIAAGQSFWVKANLNKQILNFSNAHRFNSTQTAFYKQASPDRSLIRMEIENNTLSIKDEMVVYFEEGATFGYDHDKDAYKKLNTGQSPSLYSKGSENNYSIRGLPVLTTDMHIPLGVNILANGTYTIRLTEFTNIPATSLVYFEDTATETIIDLREVDTYTINLNKGIYEDRFFIRVYAPISWVTEKADCGEDKGILEINNNSENVNWSYIINDINGYLVASENLFNGSVVKNLKKGFYTIEFLHGNYSVAEIIEIEAKQSVDVHFKVSSETYKIEEIVNIKNFTTGADNYTWDFNDGTILSDEFEPVHLYTEPGWYEIVLEANNADCSSTSVQQLRVLGELSVNVEEIEDSGVKIYGYQNMVYIQFIDSESAAKKISIINTLGQEIVSIDNTISTKLSHRIEVPAGSGQAFLVVIYGTGDLSATSIFLQGN